MHAVFNMMDILACLLHPLLYCYSMDSAPSEVDIWTCVSVELAFRLPHQQGLEALAMPIHILQARRGSGDIMSCSGVRRPLIEQSDG